MVEAVEDPVVIRDYFVYLIVSFLLVQFKLNLQRYSWSGCVEWRLTYGGLHTIHISFTNDAISEELRPLVTKLCTVAFHKPITT